MPCENAYKWGKSMIKTRSGPGTWFQSQGGAMNGFEVTRALRS